MKAVCSRNAEVDMGRTYQPRGEYHTSEKVSKAVWIRIIQSITTIIYKLLIYSPKYHITLHKLYFSSYQMKDILSHSGSTVNKILSS